MATTNRPVRLIAALVATAIVMAAGLTGCVGGPRIIPLDKRVAIDRAVVERPSGLELTTFIADLDSPTAIAFDTSNTPSRGTIVVALGGIGKLPPRIVAFTVGGIRREIYPAHVPLLSSLFQTANKIYGPIGGIALKDGEIFVSHRDINDQGVVSAFTYDGRRRTVVSDLPAKGDHSVTDLAFHPVNGRLYFGVGSATNSGVVGLDNWASGWARTHRDLADVSAVDLRLLGSRFDTRNPTGGLFGGDDIAVTAPYQPFALSTALRIPRSPSDKPGAAVYSISAGGGDLRVEAHGLRNPRGLVFNQFGNLFVANQGMELRGTRPVKDDPDAVLRVPLGGAVWYGWPDFSADLSPISETRFQPPREFLLRTGYPEVGFLIDHEASGLIRPDRETLLRGVFPSLSGAAKVEFVPGELDRPFKPFAGNLIIALSGDRAPFATSNFPLKRPVGYRVVLLDPTTRQVTDFVYNTQGMPAHLLYKQRGQRGGKHRGAIERPIDVKFGPDGALYIVDMGKIEMKNGRAVPTKGSGKIMRLAVDESFALPATSPAAD